MTLSRVAVGSLGGVAATFAGLVGAVSLTRIAGDYLGFPPGLEWTFTGAVDVASIAGGIMWTAFDGPVRRIGRPMNIVCTVVSGVGVGLDHATHSGRALHDAVEDPWPWIAFAAGLFVPALATWILHALSIIFDTASRQVDREVGAASSATSHREPAPTGPRVSTASEPVAIASSTASLVATTSTPDRDPVAARTASSRPVATASSRPPTVRQALPPSPAEGLLPGPRPDWMTTELVAAVLASMREAGAPERRYGEPTLRAEHRLGDGSELSSHKAQTLLRYIKDHQLLRVSA